MSNLIQNLVAVGLRKRSPYDPTADPSAAASPYDPPAMPNAAPPSMPIQSAQSSPDINRDVYLPQLQNVTKQLTDAYAPPQVSGKRAFFGALVGAKNPQMGDVITGEANRQRQIKALSGQEQTLNNAITQNRAAALAPLTMADTQSQIDQRTALADYARAHANAVENPPVKPTPQEEEWQGYLKANGGDPVKATQQRLADIAAAKPDKSVPEEDKAISDLLSANKLPDTPANRDKARMTLATRNRKPEDDLSRQLKELQIQEAQKKVNDPTTDEKRRGDLANNLNENLDQLEEIVKRRPELFGPVHGRITEAKGFVGTGDADVSRLKILKEQMGMAMVGAHAMRNAQHVEAAANAVMNGYHNDPKALLAAIQEARNSSQTFLKDANRPSVGASPAAPSGGNDPLGIR